MSSGDGPALRLLIGQADRHAPTPRPTWHPSQGGRPPVIIPHDASPGERARLIWRQGESPDRVRTGRVDALRGLLIDIAMWR
jgi:hypothetical protein